MDDSLMSQLKTGYTESTKPKYGVFAEKPGALVGAGSPRFLVSPFNPDAPIEGGISGAAKGALAGFVPFGVPSGSGSPSSPSKHDGIGVSGRSQAHETLGTMTTVIMRTTRDTNVLHTQSYQCHTSVTTVPQHASSGRKRLLRGAFPAICPACSALPRRCGVGFSVMPRERSGGSADHGVRVFPASRFAPRIE